MKAQDDLISLFNTHMNMGDILPKEGGVLPSPPLPITYSITQHYHHSAHLAQNPRAAERGPVHPQRDATSDTDGSANRVLEMLRHHNIESSSLSPSQLELVTKAGTEQQSRLIQMWQIYPESLSQISHGLTQPAEAGFAEELEMCDLNQDSNNDGNANHTAEPYMVAGYDLAFHDSRNHRAATPVNEPTTGFPYRVASDPIYQATGHRWWEQTQTIAMEY